MVTEEGIKVEKNNPEKLKQNIQKLHDDFARDNFSKLDGGKIARIFNDLHGSYPQLKGRLRYLNAAVDSEKFEIYYNEVLAFSYTELFDLQGNLLPSVKDVLNYNDFLTKSLKDKSPEEIEKFHGFLLSSFCTNIIGPIVWKLYGASNLELAVLLTERMYKDMEKPLNKANIERLLVAGFRVETASPASSNTPVTAPAAVVICNSEEKGLPTNEPLHSLPVSEKVTVMAEMATVNKIDAHPPIKNQVVTLSQKRAFAETSFGKVLIASLTAMLVSPVLVGVAAAIGITFPFTLPVMIVVTAVFFGVTSGFLTKVADWIGEKFAARKQKDDQSKIILNNNDPIMTPSYVNMGQAFNQDSLNKTAQQGQSRNLDNSIKKIDSTDNNQSYHDLPSSEKIAENPNQNNDEELIHSQNMRIVNQF